MAETQENEWTPGIVVLKDVALYEPGIERLGPPPGNAGVLIRGGAGWVFGVEEKPLARGIVKLDAPPPENAAVDALAREVAWLYGRDFVAPHVYSTRLGNAIQRGYAEANTRTFLGECLPHLGLDGNKYYEIAHLLWNVDSTVAAHRRDYCDALFGEVPSVQQAMVDYFNALEFYLSARPAEEQLTNLGQFSSYQGHGIIGREGWISHLDYLLRNPNSPTWEVLPLDHPDLPFTRVWGLLQQAYQNSGDNPVVRRRVQ